MDQKQILAGAKAIHVALLGKNEENQRMNDFVKAIALCKPKVVVNGVLKSTEYHLDNGTVYIFPDFNRDGVFCKIKRNDIVTPVGTIQAAAFDYYLHRNKK